MIKNHHPLYGVVRGTILEPNDNIYKRIVCIMKQSTQRISVRQRPDSEQIERTGIQCRKRNSVSVEEIQERNTTI